MKLFESVQQARGLVEMITDPDVKRKYLDVLDWSLAISTRNRELEEENADLKKNLEFKAKLTHTNNVYRSEDPKDPGPFCVPCWDSRRQAVHLSTTTSADYYRCDACGKGVTTNARPTEWSTPGGPERGITGYGSAFDDDDNPY
jgi:hypothetical protein